MGSGRSTESSRGRGKTTEYIAKKKRKERWMDPFIQELLLLDSYFSFEEKANRFTNVTQAEKAKWKGRENNNNDNNAT